MTEGSMAKNQAKTLFFQEEKILLVCHAIFEVLPSSRQNPALNQSPQRVRVQLGLLEDSFQMVNPEDARTTNPSCQLADDDGQRR